MRFIIIVKATAESETGKMPPAEMFEAMGKYNEELIKAGIMKDAAGLKPTRHAARVHFSGKNRSVIDGPFTETKELVAGFWLWECKSMEEAIEWVKKCPNPMLSDSDIEIRPYFEMEDFGASLTPELREQEAQQAAVLAKGKP
jgi:hypothetical protein